MAEEEQRSVDQKMLALLIRNADKHRHYAKGWKRLAKNQRRFLRLINSTAGAIQPVIEVALEVKNYATGTFLIGEKKFEYTVRRHEGMTPEQMLNQLRQELETEKTKTEALSRAAVLLLRGIPEGTELNVPVDTMHFIVSESEKQP